MFGLLEAAYMCMALNLNHEARNQSLLGNIAVAEVVLNRVDDDRYPDTICEVVRQGPTYKWRPQLPVKHRCQFSWFCDGKTDVPNDPYAWERSLAIAQDMVDMGQTGLLEGATHYHSIRVFPEWRKTKTRIVKIEDHIFYRWEYP